MCHTHAYTRIHNIQTCTQVLPVPCDLTGRATNIMWDVSDPSVFVVAEDQALHVMLYVPNSISGVCERLCVRVM